MPAFPQTSLYIIDKEEGYYPHTLVVYQSAAWYNWKESHSEQFYLLYRAALFVCSEYDTFLMNYSTSLVACAGNKEPVETNTPDEKSNVSEETLVPERNSAEESQPESKPAQSSKPEETESLPEAN